MWHQTKEADWIPHCRPALDYALISDAYRNPNGLFMPVCMAKKIPGDKINTGLSETVTNEMLVNTIEYLERARCILMINALHSSTIESICNMIFGGRGLLVQRGNLTGGRFREPLLFLGTIMTWPKIDPIIFYLFIHNGRPDGEQFETYAKGQHCRAIRPKRYSYDRSGWWNL
jgi:hypothetical protein